LTSFAISDEETQDAVRALDAEGYLADPHSALAWKALTDGLEEDETGVFLCTAHPAKFIETLEETLKRKIALPPALEQAAAKQILSTEMPADFDLLKKYLLEEQNI